ncbi:MAG: hypothetical protein M1826_001868 [Phylliscum demangeonii]|nr:MAG: hypothetical protein M1826_001868 [Phylliscum demangeonii]
MHSLLLCTAAAGLALVQAAPFGARSEASHLQARDGPSPPGFPSGFPLPPTNLPAFSDIAPSAASTWPSKDTWKMPPFPDTSSMLAASQDIWNRPAEAQEPSAGPSNPPPTAVADIMKLLPFREGTDRPSLTMHDGPPSRASDFTWPPPSMPSLAALFSALPLPAAGNPDPGFTLPTLPSGFPFPIAPPFTGDGGALPATMNVPLPPPSSPPSPTTTTPPMEFPFPFSSDLPSAIQAIELEGPAPAASLPSGLPAPLLPLPAGLDSAAEPNSRSRMTLALDRLHKAIAQQAQDQAALVADQSALRQEKKRPNADAAAALDSHWASVLARDQAEFGDAQKEVWSVMGRA